MAESSIEWTDYTFNPWIGCAKVHQGCANCYAEADFDHRKGRVQWGPHGTRSKTADANWREPLKWNRKSSCGSANCKDRVLYRTGFRGAHGGCPVACAKCELIRRRVFCASLADVFEDWDGPIVDNNHVPLWHDGHNDRTHDAVTMADLRCDLFELIDATPHLDWLLLTKRPENILRMWPGCDVSSIPGSPLETYHHYPQRHNVWLGTSVSDQASADKQIPELLDCRDLSPVLYLSCEPLLGAIDLSPWISQIDWVIAGGESGRNARPMHPDWVRDLRDQCEAAGVPFFFKQWGEWVPSEQAGLPAPVPTRILAGTEAECVVQARPSQQIGWVDVNGPVCIFADDGRFSGDSPRGQCVVRVGKKLAGRLLDGREWMEFPQPLIPSP